MEINKFNEIIKDETSPKKIKHWGRYSPEFTPYLCDTKLGDGLQLIYFGTLNQRPYYWLFLIDSKSDVDSDKFYDIAEEILNLIEEECGPCREENDNYPMVNSDCGWYWGQIHNFNEKEGSQ